MKDTEKHAQIYSDWCKDDLIAELVKRDNRIIGIHRVSKEKTAELNAAKTLEIYLKRDQDILREQLDEAKKLLATRVEASRLDEAVMSTHRQANCIQQCAAHIGPDTSATIDGLPLAVKRVVDERAKMAAVCDQILSIMETYHEQDASPRGVDTPGGLEHLGDVWRLFGKWETLLKASASESLGGGGGSENLPPAEEKYNGEVTVCGKEQEP